jgi:Tol biopolymer transport system component
VCRDDIWVMQVGSGATTLLTGSLNGSATAPDFGPDGDTIAFSYRPCDTCLADIYTMSAEDGSGATPLTSGLPADARSPAWSPDGNQLVFTTACGTQPCDDELFVMDATGSGLAQRGPGSNPDWR